MTRHRRNRISQKNFEKIKQLQKLKFKVNDLYKTLKERDINPDTKILIFTTLDENMKTCHTNKVRVAEKLSRMFCGDYLLPETKKDLKDITLIHLL